MCLCSMPASCENVDKTCWVMPRTCGENSQWRFPSPGSHFSDAEQFRANEMPERKATRIGWTSQEKNVQGCFRYSKVRTEAYRRYCRYGTHRQVRYDINTGSEHFGKFGTTSIPLRYVRYDINTGTGHFITFGTSSLPVPGTSVNSVQHQYLCRHFR